MYRTIWPIALEVWRIAVTYGKCLSCIHRQKRFSDTLRLYSRNATDFSDENLCAENQQSGTDSYFSCRYYHHYHRVPSQNDAIKEGIEDRFCIHQIHPETDCTLNDPKMTARIANCIELVCFSLLDWGIVRKFLFRLRLHPMPPMRAEQIEDQNLH